MAKELTDTEKQVVVMHLNELRAVRMELSQVALRLLCLEESLDKCLGRQDAGDEDEDEDEDDEDELDIDTIEAKIWRRWPLGDPW